VFDDREKRAVWSALPGRRAAFGQPVDAKDPPRTGADAKR
jgi:hypothetical protein